MNRSILIVICDFIITSMIYLNGGFSALESQPHDGRPADQTTMDIMANELEMQRAELEAARAKLLKAGGKVSQEELERISIAVETLQLWSEKMLATGVIDADQYNAHKNK